MKRFNLTFAFFLLTSMLLCAGILAQSKSRGPNDKIQLYSLPADRWITESRFVTSPNAADVNRDRQAAEQGDASAQFNMAVRYDRGLGVLQNYAEAVNWLHKAADQGLAEAQYNMGSMYYNGLGVSQDFTEAVHWFRKAADQGLAEAQKNLGAMYGRGEGVPQSHAEAYVWLSIAAISGIEDAINGRDFAASTLSSEDFKLAQNRATELNREIQQRIADK